MRTFLRFLRVAFSAFCGLACVLLIALWVRSYRTRDTCFWPGRDHAVQINSLLGHTNLYALNRTPGSQFVPFKIDHSPIEGRFKTKFNKNFLGFYFGRGPMEVRLDIPYWFWVVGTTIIAAAPWRIHGRRFSLRTLLIAITLVAVVLGFVVYT